LPEQTRLSAIVAGRVQGVSFRAFAAERALELGVVGYARNRPDGTVEVVADGDARRLERLLADLKRGAGRARVDRVDVTWSKSSGTSSGFEIL
jgi:acylphosphatase